MAGSVPAQRPSTNGFAIASLICSCVGIIVGFVVVGLVILVTVVDATHGRTGQ
jgi:hypothetical protein